MSKEVEWGVIHGEGTIVCTCDYCQATHEMDFDGGCPDYRAAQKEIEALGWRSTKVNDEWYDFHSEDCRNNFIKKYAK